MSEQQIEIVRQWYATGHISTDDLAALKVLYLREIGAPPGCKTCSSVIADIKHHFTYQLKLQNLLPVSTNSKVQARKYIILGAGFLMLPGDSTIIVNDGQESEDRKLLTDAMAEEILTNNPSYSALIGINPQWVDPNPSDEADDESEEEESDDETAKSELQTKYDELQAKYDALVEEHEQTKQELTTTKGKLTRATNKLAASAQPVPNDPIAPVTPPATPETSTDTTGVGNGDALESLPATAPASDESKGNEAADSTQAVINEAKA
ncbi:hypothetical protein [Spirosoma aerophilum]